MTSICVVEADGSPVWEGKAESEPVPLVKALSPWRDKIALVGIEACPLSEWLYGAKAVAAHLGLTPRVYQSGEIDRSCNISKCGDKLMRHALYEAANSHMRISKKWSTLRAWGSMDNRRRIPTRDHRSSQQCRTIWDYCWKRARLPSRFS